MYNIQVHVPYEKQQYIKKMNHYITTYIFMRKETGLRAQSRTLYSTSQHSTTWWSDGILVRKEAGLELSADCNIFIYCNIFI